MNAVPKLISYLLCCLVSSAWSMMPANTGSSKNMGWGSASRMAPWEEREKRTHQMWVSWENQGIEETGNVGVNRLYTYASWR